MSGGTTFRYKHRLIRTVGIITITLSPAAKKNSIYVFQKTTVNVFDARSFRSPQQSLNQAQTTAARSLLFRKCRRNISTVSRVPKRHCPLPATQANVKSISICIDQYRTLKRETDSRYSVTRCHGAAEAFGDPHLTVLCIGPTA